MGELRHGVRFKTPRNADIFEKWLDENCSGESELIIEEFAVGKGDKKVAVYFEKQSDLDIFKKSYSSI